MLISSSVLAIERLREYEKGITVEIEWAPDREDRTRNGTG